MFCWTKAKKYLLPVVALCEGSTATKYTSVVTRSVSPGSALIVNFLVEILRQLNRNADAR
jgi:hypothetical protein